VPHLGAAEAWAFASDRRTPSAKLCMIWGTRACSTAPPRVLGTLSSHGVQTLHRACPSATLGRTQTRGPALARAGAWERLASAAPSVDHDSEPFRYDLINTAREVASSVTHSTV
jgi:hypothetical protein